jgi:RNA polymerase sigma-70 factor (ECF subfamily)
LAARVRRTRAAAAGSAFPTREQLAVTSPNRLSQVPDLELVALARKGREQAEEVVGELMRRYRSEVLEFICQIVRDPDLAEDLTQDTFVKVLTRLDGHGPERDVEGWIFTIANHVAVDHLREKPTGHGPARHRVGHSWLRRDQGRLASRQPHAVPHAGLRRPPGRVGNRALPIATLKGLQRRCMQLRYLEARSYDDIASTLGLSVGTVSSHLHRGRNALRKQRGDLPEGMS